MSAGAPVLASDLDAFRRVLDDGALGVLFPTGDAGALAAQLLGLLADPARRSVLRDRAGAAVRRYDWSVVADEVLAVYETVVEGVATAGRPGQPGRP
jgi:phosphatidyl-myo-inositol alpha-mannosyltransferase